MTPVINGWVMAVGTCLPTPDIQEDSFKRWRQLMKRLSTRFDEAYFFGTHRVSSYAAWARYEHGLEKRLFAYADDILQESGKPYPEEIEALKNLANLANVQDEFHDAVMHGEIPKMIDLPNEDFVQKLSGLWSINPFYLNELGLPPSVGLVGCLTTVTDLSNS